MSTDYTKIANLLKLVSDLIKDGNLNAIDNAYREIRRIRAKSIRSTQPSEKLKSDLNKTVAIVEADIKRLEGFETRAEAENYLNSIAPRKADLELVARALKLPLSKREGAEELVGKIIDASVGYKLRSKAIRGGEADEPTQDKPTART